MKRTFVSLCMVVICGLVVLVYENRQTFSLGVQSTNIKSQLIRERKETTGKGSSQNAHVKVDKNRIGISPTLHLVRKTATIAQTIESNATARTKATEPRAVEKKISNVEADPPLRNDEPPLDINFNIERTFTIGVLDKTKTNAIPNRIHFMWNNETVPAQFVDNLKTFLVHNPDWEYYFWTLEKGRALIRRYHPAFLPIFDAYTQDVNRADSLRYIFMYHFGGAYFDLDSINLKSLNSVIKDKQCIVSPEPMEHSVFAVGIRSLLGNAVFLCTPRHGFFKSLIDALPSTRRSRGILLVAGPMFYTHSFNKYIYQSSKQQRNAPREPNQTNAVGEQISVISCSVFLDKVRPNIHRMMAEKCPQLIATRTARFASSNCLLLIRTPKLRGRAALAGCKEFLRTYRRTEACLKWDARGGAKRTLSTIAVNDHTYYGTYIRPKSLVYLPENHIKNIIPNVKMYAD